MKDALGERKCNWCGKTFCAAPYHIFKDGHHWFCKYTCMLRYRETLKRKSYRKKDSV